MGIRRLGTCPFLHLGVFRVQYILVTWRCVVSYLNGYIPQIRDVAPRDIPRRFPMRTGHWILGAIALLVAGSVLLYIYS